MKCAVCGHYLAFHLNRSFEVLKLTAVGILIRLSTGRSGLRFPTGARFFTRTQNAHSEFIFLSVLKLVGESWERRIIAAWKPCYASWI
jgi:hypothetical protein